MAGKPDIKVGIKAKGQDAGKPVMILAAWRGDNGRMSGRLDRNVVELAVKLEDGTIVRVKRGEDGKETSWINVYEGDGAGASSPAAGLGASLRAGAARSGKPADVPDDGYGPPDDLPF